MGRLKVTQIRSDIGGKPNQRDFSPAQDAFTRLLGKDMPAIDTAFRTWLRTI